MTISLFDLGRQKKKKPKTQKSLCNVKLNFISNYEILTVINQVIVRIYRIPTSLSILHIMFMSFSFNNKKSHFSQIVTLN